jgi:hypothetical protein
MINFCKQGKPKLLNSLNSQLTLMEWWKIEQDLKYMGYAKIERILVYWD